MSKSATDSMRISFMKTTLSLATAACFLSACSMAPVYERPDSPVSTSWQEKSASVDTQELQSSASKLDWQSFIVDDNLRSLVSSALENNRDLRQATLNIEAARAQYRIQRADRVPNIGA